MGRIGDTGEKSAADMKTVVGFCPKGKGAPAVGRLIFNPKEHDLPRHGAFLSVFWESNLGICDCEGQMGVILVGSSVLSGKELARITAPVIMIPELPEDCIGKIGLLDPSAATLFISPDLATLTRYSKAWHGLDNRPVDLRAVRADGHLFRWRCDLSGTLDCRADGWLLDCRGQTATDTEEGWYERFCDVADVAEGQSIMALVSWERTTMDHLSFRSMLRGLYRAAVYGSFSVLIGGCVTPSDVRTARAEANRAFCELEGEGREFNGYIPKGILIESPAMLFSASVPEGSDFVCLSVDLLFSRFTGEQNTEQEENAVLWQMIEAAWKQGWLGEGRIRACALLERGNPDVALCELLLRCGITDWFFLREDPFLVGGYLRELGELREKELKNLFKKFSKNT